MGHSLGVGTITIASQPWVWMVATHRDGKCIPKFSSHFFWKRWTWTKIFMFFRNWNNVLIISPTETIFIIISLIGILFRFAPVHFESYIQLKTLAYPYLFWSQIYDWEYTKINIHIIVIIHLHIIFFCCLLKWSLN